jgi:hypothetical protein
MVAAGTVGAGGGRYIGRPSFGLTWPPVQESFNRTQRRQFGQLLSHLVRAARQALQLKGNFFVSVATFCFFGGPWPLCDMGPFW